MNIDRHAAVANKNDAQLVIEGAMHSQVCAVRNALNLLEERPHLENGVMGCIVVLATLVEAFPERAEFTVNRREILAWRNKYGEILQNLRPTKKQPKTRIAKELQWLRDECDNLMTKTFNVGFFDDRGQLIVNPYGDYASEDYGKQ